MKTKLFFMALLFFWGSNALQAQSTIEENGYVYTQVMTVAELEDIGVTVNEAVAYDEAKKRRPTPKLICKPGKGGCFCNAALDDAKNISSTVFLEQEDWDTGETIPAKEGVLPYYNAELDEVIFR